MICIKKTAKRHMDDYKYWTYVQVYVQERPAGLLEAACLYSRYNI